jgi:hypothetical protein
MLAMIIKHARVLKIKNKSTGKKKDIIGAKMQKVSTG